ncbi:MAG TPA: hypothetical protein VK477_08960, partial [Acidobacteriota bacterium]|nr:hypothetical protein [Acidobacteriota bacterium]
LALPSAGDLDLMPPERCFLLVKARERRLQTGEQGGIPEHTERREDARGAGLEGRRREATHELWQRCAGDAAVLRGEGGVEYSALHVTWRLNS